MPRTSPCRQLGACTCRRRCSLRYLRPPLRCRRLRRQAAQRQTRTVLAARLLRRRSQRFSTRCSSQHRLRRLRTAHAPRTLALATSSPPPPPPGASAGLLCRSRRRRTRSRSQRTARRCRYPAQSARNPQTRSLASPSCSRAPGTASRRDWRSTSCRRRGWEAHQPTSPAPRACCTSLRVTTPRATRTTRRCCSRSPACTA